ncbi:DUF6148 family protein [Ferviditalea candida]|uniref:DUF6148 family protein n=1 Tax=Ferviditalea candida TaxID=3108399 RepID=A0ABU5ZKN3_9BACL|nr:DUF6148 family protein [Paenibacillaceae bacterium T2]
MATRLETLQIRLQQYINCEAAILGGAQEYMISNRRMTRAGLYKVAEMIQYLEREIEVEKSRQAGTGRNRVFGVIPRDL